MAAADIVTTLLNSPVLVAAIPSALALVAGRQVLAAKDERIAALKEAHEAELRARDAQIAALEQWSPASMQQHVEAMKQFFEYRVEQVTEERDSIRQELDVRQNDDRVRGRLQDELEARQKELAEALSGRTAAAQASETLATLSTLSTGERGERGERYRAFFTTLVDKARAAIPGVTTSTRGQPQSWFNFPAGRTGFSYSVEFLRHSRLRVGLYIDTQDKGRNKAYFDRLAADRVAIEADFAGSLVWERWDNKQACMILSWLDGSLDDSPSELEHLQEQIVEVLRRMRPAFAQRIQLLPRLPNTATDAPAAS